MTPLKRYTLCTIGDNRILLTPSSTDIMKVMKSRPEIGYDSLSKKTDIPIASLYVFTKRLESCGLVKRKQVIINGRVTTILKATDAPWKLEKLRATA